MAKSLRDLMANPESSALDHGWSGSGILLEHEMTTAAAEALRGTRPDRQAAPSRLRGGISITEQPARLDRTLFLKLAGCDWIHEHRHCLLTGPCGVGKSWLACALGFKACRENLSVLYQRVPRLFTLLALGRGDGRYTKLMGHLGRESTYSISRRLGSGTAAASSSSADLLEIVEEDRYNAGSLIITSQLPVDRWCARARGKSGLLADAILDRIIHNAYRVWFRS